MRPSCTAIARPIPDVAPVTSALCPRSSPCWVTVMIAPDLVERQACRDHRLREPMRSGFHAARVGRDRGNPFGKPLATGTGSTAKVSDAVLAVEVAPIPAVDPFGDEPAVFLWRL